MTNQKKNYTNNDLMKELKAVKDTQVAQGQDISMLKEWRQGIEIGKAAVAEYKQQEASDKKSKEQATLSDLVRNSAPYILIILAGLAIIVFAYSTRPH